METKEYLNQLGISDELIDLSIEAENQIKDTFKAYEDICAFNQLKVLKAMQDEKLSNMHFNWHTGYGYDDPGREKIEAIFSRIFNTEDAIVRPTIANGTHALTLCLRGLLRPGDTLISIAGKPYDTLDEVIGITNKYNQSLKDIGVFYKQIDLLEGGFDFQAIENAMDGSTKMIYIQRSTGYGWRKALSMAEIAGAIDFVKSIRPDVIVMIDNCYGEFLDYRSLQKLGQILWLGL